MSRRVRGAVVLGGLLAACAAGGLLVQRCKAREPVATSELGAPGSSAVEARGARAPRAGATSVAANGRCTIAGHVYADARPIGASVALRTQRTGLAITATAGEDGRFELTPASDDDFVLAAGAPGYAVTLLPVRCASPRATELEVFLRACDRKTHGRVLNAYGDAIADATIESAGIVVARSDAGGAFELCLGGDAEGVVVRADGFAPAARSLDGVGELEVVLIPEAILAVKVVDEEGRVVEGAEVIAEVRDEPYALRPGTFKASKWFAAGRGVTGREGVVELEGRPLELHEIRATLGDRNSDPAEAELTPATRREVTVALRAAAWVRGTARTAGAPVAGVVIEGPAGVAATTGDDGSFALALPPGSRGVLGARAPWAIVERTEVIAGETPPVALDVTRAGALRGTVRYRGQGVAGARVVTETSSTTTNGDGSFELFGPTRTSELDVTATSDPLAASGTKRIGYTVGADVDGIAIELARGAVVAGTVVDEAGKPLSGVRLELSGAWATISDAAGAFELTRITPGTHLLSALVGHVRPELLAGAGPLEIAAEQELRGHRVTARMRVGTITGIVVDAKGAPVPSAWVYSEPQLRDTYSDEDGKFRATIPADGPVTIYAVGAIGQFGHAENVDAGGSIRIALRSPGAIRITCEGDSAERTVLISRRQGGTPRRAHCGETVTSLVPDVYTVSGASSSVETEVAEGTTKEVTIATPATSQLRIAVTIDGQPPTGAGLITCRIAEPPTMVRVPVRGGTATVPRGRHDLACELRDRGEGGNVRGRASVDATGPVGTVSVDLRAE